MNQIYQHQYEANSVYGHVIALLREHALDAGVLIDIGCGYGGIAEPVRDDLRLTYVGFDLAADGLADLRQRGFETHEIDLSQAEAAEATIRARLEGRPLAGITFMDTLEHLVDGQAVLAMLRRLAGEQSCPLVLSVPNVSHHHIASKLLVGKWEMTEAGLLDHTHVAFFTAPRLKLFTSATGWKEVANYDFKLEESDQSFPADLPVIQHRAPLGHFLRRTADNAHLHSIVNQFVRAYLPTAPRPISLLADRASSETTFLTIVIRAGDASRIEALRGLLAALVGQSDQSFDIRFVLHKCIDQEPFRALLDELPPAFRRRIALIRCDQGGPAEAYNVAVEDLESRYAAFLDGSAVPLANWVSTFRKMADSAPGGLLQTRCRKTEGEKEPAADLVGALFNVRSDLPSLAFPSGMIRHLGLRFDPSYPAHEERDFIAGAAQISAIVDSDEITCERAADTVSAADTLLSENRLLRRLNGEEILLPAGSAARIKKILHESTALGGALGKIVELEGDIEKLRGESHELAEARQNLLTELTETRQSLLTELTETRQSLLAEIALLNARLNTPNPLTLVLRTLEEHGQENTTLAELVRSYNADAKAPIESDTQDAPFLSIVTRTRGTRIDTLREVLLCLGGQTCQDFELIIVLHKCRAPAPIKQLVESFPESLKQRIRISQCNSGGRAAPLNVGVELARGSYIAFLDDDDFVLGHWVETFHRLATEQPGRLLRTVCARQDTGRGGGIVADSYPMATTWFMPFASNYDLFSHLENNSTPFMAVAFPRFLFQSLGQRFDETLSTTEDWEFTTRAAIYCGVHESPEITSIYRWWTNAHSSFTEHPQEEWQANHRRILDRTNSKPLLLPPGSAGRITGLINETRALAHERNDLSARLSAEHAALEEQRRLCEGLGTSAEEIRNYFRAETAALLNSRSWRYTRLLRRLTRLVRRGAAPEFTPETLPSSIIELFDLNIRLRRSQSWQAAAPIRFVGHILTIFRGRRTGAAG